MIEKVKSWFFGLKPEIQIFVAAASTIFVVAMLQALVGLF